MLIKVIVKNYILIDDLEIDFDAGLNVLTGETGAGKSVILGAIRLALGGRGSTNVVRQGASKAVVQAVFTLSQDCAKLLSDTIDVSEEIVIFRRELQQNGKSIMKVNDAVLTLNQARKIADLLLNIHGQNDYQALLDGDGQLQLIDSFLSAAGQADKRCVAELYADLYNVKRRMDELTIEPQRVEREIELISFQIDDIDKAALTADDEDIEARYKQMTRATQLMGDLADLKQLIDSEGEEPDLARTLNRLIQICEGLAEPMPAYQTALEQLNDFSYYLAELASMAQSDSESLFERRANQDQLTRRLDLVNSLKKKYGKTIDDILTYRAGLDERLSELQHLAELKDQLQSQYEALRQKYVAACRSLSVQRRQAAVEFDAKLCAELVDLQFDDVKLVVDLEKRKQFSAHGCDLIDIKISLNRGMQVDSLKKIASGGEVSRLMLAIKRIIASKDGVAVLIFDEIDSGISGLTGSAVADKLYSVARHHQVICISHLAQVALMADRHFLIVKDTVDDLAISKVFPLTKIQRIEEIARLISGKMIDDSQRAQAKRLIERAQNHKITITDNRQKGRK